MSTATLPAHDDWHTLFAYPGTDVSDFAVANNGCYIVEYSHPSPVLQDTWTAAQLRDGRRIEVRRADCGAGCRCAGEFRFVGQA